MPDRPDDLFDREREWADLTDFVTGPPSGVSLGIIYGRRRQGKSFLLRRLVAATGGLYHQALEEGRSAALARVGDAVAAHRGLAAGHVTFRDWSDALRALLEPPSGPPRTTPRTVVLDELPYLLAHSPEIASALQQLVDTQRDVRRGPGTALLVCGSAISIMSALLEGARAMRGRARLELVMRPFDYRQAREFWGVRDPQLAFTLHAVVGGTPGYRDVLGEAPRSLRAFGAWLARGILNPSHALFRESEYVLAEDPRLTDRGLYHTVLEAVSRGERSPTRIAARLGRPEGALRHPLRLLEEAELLHRTEDVLRQRNPLLSVADPIVRFQHVVMRPRMTQLEERRAVEVWEAVQPTFSAQILGPHFEHLARVWTGRVAAEEALGGPVGEVGPTTVSDPGQRVQIEVDVVALAAGERKHAKRAVVRLLGEAKASERPRGLDDLRRLERARALLAASDRADVSHARLALFGRRGFTPDLRRTAGARRDLVLVDLERMYEET